MVANCLMDHHENKTTLKIQSTSQTHHLHSTIDHLLSSLANRRQNPVSLLSATRRLVSLASPFLADTHLANRLLALFSKLGSVQDARDLFDQLLHRDRCSYNTIISAYSNAGHMEDALEVFDKMPERDHFSWTAIISAYTRHGSPLQALNLYRQMFRTNRRSELCKIDNRFTASCALVASTSIPCINHGKEIHCHVIRSQFESDMVFYSALVDMYSKCGYINYARHVFDLMPRKDVVSWSAMMSRYFDNGLFLEGFKVFSDMARCDVRPNEFTFTGLLQASTDLTIEETGRQVHGKMVRLGACEPSSLFGQSALVHMYSKCGSVDDACKVFDEMTKPDLVSWTAIITGCAQNGLPEKAIRYYDILVKSGIKPDHVTFIGVLTACAHAGLVDKGREIFNSIKKVYGLEYSSDHYACLVDILSRCGKLEETEEVIAKMPMKPNKFLWASLLHGSRIHKNLKLGKRAAEALFEIEPDNPATYVTLANMYSSSSLFDEVEKIREIMANKGMMKEPGSCTFG